MCFYAAAIGHRKRGSSMVSRWCKRSQVQSPSWRGKFLCPNTLSLVSFAGMTLDKCAILQIGTLTLCPLCRETHPLCRFSDFILPFLPPYMGVIPNPKMAFIFPISRILILIFPIFMIYFPKYEGKGSFPVILFDHF